MSGDAWLITPEKLLAIQEIVERRAGGLALSDAEIEAAIGAGEGDSEAGYRVVGSDAVIPIRGVIIPRASLFSRTSGVVDAASIRESVQAALADTNVKRLVFDIDSPGGNAAGIAETAAAIRRAGSIKPTVASVNGMAGSAGYWLAAAARKIVASEGSQIGSIGAYTIHTEVSKAHAEAGITDTVVKFGRFKAAGNGVEPLSEEAKSSLQERIDAVGNLFVDSVAVYRGVSAAHVRANYGDGKVYMATEAKARGMIDDIGTLDDVLAGGTAASAPGTTQLIAFAGGRTVEAKAMFETIRKELAQRGLVAANASELETRAVFNAWCSAKGINVPTDEAGVAAAFAAPGAAAANQTTVAVNVGTSAREEVVKALNEERHRVAEVKAACQIAGLSGDEADALIAEGLPVAESKAKIIDLLAKRSSPVTPIVSGAAAVDKFKAEAIEGLSRRVGLEVERQTEGGRIASQWSLVELAKNAIAAAGGRPELMTVEELWRGAMGGPQYGGVHLSAVPYSTTGGLPSIFANVQNKTLLRGYNYAPVTYPEWTARGASVPDFKAIQRTRYGALDLLERKTETGEIAYGKHRDNKETYAVETFAKKWDINFVMFRNDDLSAFTRLGPDMGAAARRTIENEAVNYLLSNPTLGQDGGALFNSTAITTTGGHNNLFSPGTALSHDALTTMRAAMRLQRGLENVEPLNIEPRVLLVPAALETTAYLLVNAPTFLPSLTTIQANASVPNPYQGLLRTVVCPLLDAASTNDYYLFADPAMWPAIEISFLSGHERPQMDDWYDPDRQVRWYSVTQTWGLGALDFRPCSKNLGGS